MALKNPVESLLYDFGYDGRENLYEFWNEYRQEFIQFLSSPKAKKYYTKEQLDAFNLQVRWASHYGIFYRLYIEIFFIKAYEFEGFDNIPMVFSGRKLKLNDFIGEISTDIKPIQKIDLRGIYLIDYSFENLVIENVDFSYANLDYTQFKKCQFKNCIFNNTSFYRAEIINCHFDKTCKFNNNDFVRANIDSAFDCLIDLPKIKMPKLLGSIKMFLNMESYPLNYTRISSQSFINNCDDRMLRVKLGRKYGRVIDK